MATMILGTKDYSKPYQVWCEIEGQGDFYHVTSFRTKSEARDYIQSINSHDRPYFQVMTVIPVRVRTD